GAVGGLFQSSYDVAATPRSSPLFAIETFRVGGDPQRHRGAGFGDDVAELVSVLPSLVPGTSAWDAQVERVRVAGTWDAHEGLDVVEAVLDVETFLDDPGRWAGDRLPDVVVTVLAGGGGVVSTTSGTARRLSEATRRLAVRLRDTGVSSAQRRRSPVGADDLAAVTAVPVGGSPVGAPAPPVGAPAPPAGAVPAGAVPADAVPLGAVARPRGAAPGGISLAGPGDEFAQFAARRANVDPDGVYDVVAHGTVSHIIVNAAGHDHYLDAGEVAALLMAVEDYQPGRTVRLLSCSTGALDHGFAAQLARRLHAPVIAPDDVVWAYEEGALRVSRPSRLNDLIPGSAPRPAWRSTGGWRRFDPDGTIEAVRGVDDLPALGPFPTGLPSIPTPPLEALTFVAVHAASDAHLASEANEANEANVAAHLDLVPNAQLAPDALLGPDGPLAPHASDGESGG
ncbi:MAG: hypothetical protein ACFCVK_26200, partial [Acidimicrobiales bacterium]